MLGYWIGELARGCRLCMEGLKVVIFITGLCGLDCFYCPISFERRRAGAFYADEERATSVELLIDEIAVVGARGASITGGEPFQRFDLTANVVKLLKDVCGYNFHLHLYTSGFGATRCSIKYMERLGLDEIRFHVVNDSVWRLVEYAARETAMDVGIEVPSIPGRLEELWRIVTKAEELKVKFVNLNELEVSETNLENLLFRGYKIADDGRAVTGSAETAKEVLSRAERAGLRVSLHFCPAKYKDEVQHRRRLLRKAARCLSLGESLSQDGALIRDGKEVAPLLDICAPTVGAHLP